MDAPVLAGLKRTAIDIALDKISNVYTFDTSCFYTDEEKEIDQKLQKARGILAARRKVNSKFQKKHIKKLNKIIADTKAELKQVIENNIGLTRELRPEAVSSKNIVGIFDSELIRASQMTGDGVGDFLSIIKVYFFGVFESLVKNGYTHNGEKYVFFSASAGQIRTKKAVFVKESRLNEIWNTLSCGLSIEKINERGGVNTNKYLAYLALCNSATDRWEDFNIDDCIVVDDLETSVTGLVDYIDEATYDIERKTMDVSIKHTDGCGMILPSLKNKNFMIRAPWIKGLLSPFPFDKFIREQNRKNPGAKCGVIKDIYGAEHDVLAEGVKIIFTKSQFKMWDYYSNWDEYKTNFKQYGCSAGICNEEQNYIETAKFNYQMLQTLADMSDDELATICEKTNDAMYKLSTDRNTMLRVFGATSYNQHKNDFQKCLSIYPELLQDVYTKESLREIKASIRKQALGGKFDINAKYLFIIPDLYAFCERLFLGIDTPKGLLGDGEVYCRAYPQNKKLDCLRSPHLYMEHAIRKNVYGENSEYKRWFNTNGIYTSTYDLISKILMFDNDGDISLVCADETIIKVAERNASNIVPLNYNMRKAPKQILTPDAMYKGMVAAYTGGNIGEISNNITKIWNSAEPNLDAIKILCYRNNLTIDYAKTLFKPAMPKDKEALIRKSCSGKVPHFFLYAKDKLSEQVASKNNSCVNRLDKIIHTYKFNFDKKMLGEFDYKMLMDNPNTEIQPQDMPVIRAYYNLTKAISFRLAEEDDQNNFNYVYSKIREQLLYYDGDINHLTDIIIKQIFSVKKAKHKAAFWSCFGDIVFTNLQRNIDAKTVMCSECGKRFYRRSNSHILCDLCAANHKNSGK